MSAILPVVWQTRHGRTVTVRTPEADDAEGLLDLVRSVLAESVWSVAQLDEFKLTVGEERAYIETHRHDPKRLLLVADADGVFVGTLNFAPGTRRLTSHTGGFGLVVRQGWRGEGLGEKLLTTLLEWAPPADIERVSLKVHSTNDRAQGLYRKLGFLEEGRLRRELRYGPGNYVDSIVTAKWLGEVA